MAKFDRSRLLLGHVRPLLSSLYPILWVRSSRKATRCSDMHWILANGLRALAILQDAY